MSNFTLDYSDLQALTQRLLSEGKRGETEIARGMSDLRRRTKTWAIRETEEILNARRVSIAKRTYVSGVAGASFNLVASNDPISLESFDARQLGRSNIGPNTRGYGNGVSVRVLISSPRTVLGSAFIARGKGDSDNKRNLLVYERRPKDRPGKNGGKLRVLYGPSVADQHAKPKFQAAAQVFLTNTASDLLRARIERLVKRRG